MNYLIIGYGKFGRLAVERLLNLGTESTITIVEQNRDQIDGTVAPQVKTVVQDGISFLVDSAKIGQEDVVVPMVPFHLAASFISSSTPGCRAIPFAEELESLVPNPFPLDQSNLCCSKAEFMCPDDCPEGDLCTVTGMPREPLYHKLESLEITGFTVLVQRSFQILPGVGGYRYHDLCRMKEQSTSGKYLIATSCKCHAILTALQV